MNRRLFVRSAATVGVGSALTLVGHAQDAPPGNDGLVTTDAQAAIDGGLAKLVALQAGDGGYADRTGFGNVAVAGLAGLALLAGGHHPGRGRYGRAVSKAADYVVGKGSGAKAGYLQNTDGFFSHGAMYQHGFGTLFLAEVCGTFPAADKQGKVREMLEKAVALTVKSQNRDGGWRYDPQPTGADVSVTVAQLMALRAAKNAGVYVDKSVIDKCVEYIKGCRLADSGYCYQKGQPGTGSMFPRSAAAVVGLFSAGIYDGHPDYKKYVEGGLKYLMRYLPGRRPGNIADLRLDHYWYGQYYAALAMWSAGKPYWTDWFPAIRGELLAKRNPTGGWDDFNGTAYATAMACIILQLPNNYLPIMQK
jgi:hypothetical protein